MRDRFDVPCAMYASKLSSCNLQQELHAKKRRRFYFWGGFEAKFKGNCMLVHSYDREKKILRKFILNKMWIEMWRVALNGEHLQECSMQRLHSIWCRKKDIKKMMHFKRIINCHLSSSPVSVGFYRKIYICWARGGNDCCCFHLSDLKINESRRVIYCHLVNVSFWIHCITKLI